MTDDERRQIIEARAGGTSAAALARRFSVSTRTIYNTLGRAKRACLGLTTTISTRLSAHQLAGFQAALPRRGIIDQPAALRRLLGAADILLALSIRWRSITCKPGARRSPPKVPQSTTSPAS
ncbi:MAG: HTH domain-containing protein [Loktanella sp.]|nr:HTH domain-containing protein [Loktanella sp.]MBR3371842.1 HTH domain-containing protein [Paracoccaceae bacterium]